MENDDSDGDSYFDQLQEAADRLDDERDMQFDVQPNDTKHHHFNTEVEYFEHIQQNNEGDSKIISSETNIVWQELLRSALKNDADHSNHAGRPFQCIDLVHDRDNPRILLIEQWLLGQIPISSYALARLRSRYLVDTENLTLWIDDFLHPSTLILARYKHDISMGGFSFIGHIFSALPSMNDLRPLLTSFLPTVLVSPPESFGLTCDQKLEPSQIEFESVDDRIAYLVQDILNTPSMSRGAVPRNPVQVYSYVVYVYQGSVELLRNDAGSVPPIPGYQLRPLVVDDAAIVDENWRYRHPGSLQFIQKLIQQTPCAGVQETATGQLVCWGLTYPYGAIGMMYTLEDHRRKGLARALLRYMLPLWCRATDWGCAPYCHIDPTNDSSRTLFASLGFAKVADQTWMSNQ